MDLIAKAEEVAAATRQIVQDQLGLKLAGKPQVAIRAKAGKPTASRPVQEPQPAPAALPAREEAPYLPPAPAETEPAPLLPEGDNREAQQVT